MAARNIIANMGRICRGRIARALARPAPPALKAVLRNDTGSLLAETILVVAVFTLLGSALLSSMQTGIVAKRTFATDSTAENLIRNQLAHVLALPYATPPDGHDPYYAAIAPEDREEQLGFDPVAQGFSLVTTVEEFTSGVDDLSRVHITVEHNGAIVKEIETVKASE